MSARHSTLNFSGFFSMISLKKKDEAAIFKHEINSFDSRYAACESKDGARKAAGLNVSDHTDLWKAEKRLLGDSMRGP